MSFASPIEAFRVAMAERFKSLDFAIRRHEFDTKFFKRIPIGEQFIQDIFRPYGADMALSISAGISAYAVEELYGEILGEPYEETEPRAGTLEVILRASLEARSPLEWIITPTTNIAEITSEIYQHYSEFALKHLESIQTLNDVFIGLSPAAQETRFFFESAVDLTRATKAIITSYLMDDPTLFESTIEREQERFKHNELDYRRLNWHIEKLKSR